MRKDKNVRNPAHFGVGVTDAATVAEEHARVKRLEEMLGPAVQVLGLEYSQRILDAIVDRRGLVPEFKAKG